MSRVFLGVEMLPSYLNYYRGCMEAKVCAGLCLVIFE